MPYVEGFETWPFGEEWLLEAIAACYVPLLGLLDRLAGPVTPVATIGVTPVFADQLEQPEVGRRFLEFMRGVRRECHRLDCEGLEQAGERAPPRPCAPAARLRARRGGVRGQDGDLLGALARLRDAGVVDLWTSAATHAVLPLRRDRARRACCSSDRHRCAPGALRRLERRAVAAGMRLPAGARGAAGARRARLLRRPDGATGERGRSTSWSPLPPAPARSRCRSTG